MRNSLLLFKNWLWQIHKIFLSILALSAITLSSYGQYTPVYFQDAGYPGGVATGGITTTTGWTQIVPPSAATNQWSSTVAIPFAFDFYGSPVTHFRVSSNGLLTFDTLVSGAAPGPNTALPSAGVPDNTIASYWDDFTTTPPVGTNDAIWVNTFGTAPNRQFFIKWFSHEWAALSFVYVGIILEESTNTVYALDLYSTTPTGSSTTVGVQQNSTTATMVGDNIPFAGNGTALTGIDYYAFYPPGLCLQPSGGSAVNVTASSATGVWNANGAGLSFDLELGLAGFTQGTGITVSTTDTFYNATGLSANTAYDWYVRKICGTGIGDTSVWSGPFSFSTTLNPLTNPTACGEGIALPDGGNSISIPITVSGAGTALGTDVVLTNVNLVIEHTWRSDVDLFLRSPNGVLVELTTDNGGSGDDYGDSTGGCAGVFNFNMFAPSAVTTFGTGSPTVGSYIPEGDFATFNDGSSPNGAWTLEYTDDASGDVGTFQYAELTFGAPPLTNPTACGVNLLLPDNNDPAFENIGLIVNTTVGTQLGVDVVVSDVNLVIDHTWRSDIILNLVSPNGVSVQLLDENGGSADHFGTTVGGCTNVLNLSASTTVSVSTITGTPGVGTYAPIGNFSAFNDGSNPNGLWTLEYQDVAGGDVGTLQYVEMVFSAPACLFPVNLNTVNITANSATGVWSSQGGPSALYEVELGAAGFTQGTGTIVAVTDTFVNVTTLSPATSYDWYVREICGSGDTSIWSGPATFQTPCVAFAAPFTENFDGLALVTPFTALPNCWEPQVGPDFWDVTNDLVNTGHTFLPNIGDHTTGSANYMWIDASGDITANEMVSPQIDLSGLTNPFSGFWFASNNTTNATNHTISLDVWDGSVWVNMTSLSGNFPGWVEVSAAVPSGIPSVTKFRIQALPAPGTTSANFFQNDLGVDDFFVIEAPTCIAPTSLSTVTVSANNATGVWNSNGTGTSWQVEYGTAGFALGTGTSAIVTDTFVNVTGLSPSTCYDWYVREICGPADTSLWAGPNGFCTPCIAITAPYAENADAVTAPALPLCWSSTSGSATQIQTVTATDHGVPIPSAPNCFEINDVGGDNILVSPEFSDLPSGTNQVRVKIAFEGGASTFSDSLLIGVMTNPSDPTTFVPLDFVTIPIVTQQFQEFVFPMTNTAAIGSATYVGFRYRVNGGGFEYFLDDFFYEPAATCASPNGFAQTGATLNSVDISWVSNGTGTNWEIEHGAVGFTLGTGTMLASTTPANTTISGLASSSSYHVYIREICGAGDSSTWSGPFTASTALGNPTACGVNQVLPDNNDPGFLDIEIDASNAPGTALGIDVVVRSVNIIIDHTWVSDVTLELVSPAGDTVALFSGYGGSGDNIGLSGATCDSVCSFTDNASTLISAGAPPFVGQFVPDEALSGFASGPAAGVWTLRYQDDAGGDVGTLQFVEIVFGITNDDVCSATELVVGGPQASFTNEGATADSLEPIGSCYSDGTGSGALENTVWFYFVAPNAGAYNVSTNFPPTPNDDTQISAYLAAAGCGDYSGFSEIGCSDDVSASNFLSEMTTSSVNAGDTIYVQVDGWAGTVGSFDIQVTAVAAPVANFSFTNTGQTFSFTDLSTNNPTSWSWDFGDGTGTANGQNPNYSYTAQGSYTVTLIASNASGSDTTSQTVSVPTGLNNNLSQFVNVYPNPAKDRLVIDVTGNTLQGFEIIDMMGRTVMISNEVITAQKEINVSDLVSGNYIMKLNFGDDFAQHRFVIQK